MSEEGKEVSHEVQVENDMLAAANTVEVASMEKKEEPKTPLPSPETEAEFLGDEENKKNCLDLAVQIGEFMGNKWFTVEMFRQKTGLNQLEAIQRLQLSKLFGHVKMRMGNWEDGAKKNGKPLFKVAITKEARLQAIDEVIEYHKKQIEHFELQKKGIL